jgi:diamine N-acetyltransferase
LGAHQRTRAERAEREADAYRDEVAELCARISHDTDTITASIMPGAACGLEIRPEQNGVVAPVAWSLAAAYTAPEIAWPRLVYDGDRPVAFIMGAFDPDGGVELFRSFLWRLNVGAEYQGKGYGRFAVEGLCAEALRRGQHRLMVSWKEHEHGPEGFYLRLGFRLTGERNQVR